jgi:glycosyltransferase involved in cell wall biosynthesis
MTHLPFFSIIIPTYNSQRTINRCLDSISCQEFKDFEVLIMDGFSVDDTLKIAGSYNDPRIKIYSENDKGIYDAMNKGIKLVLGQWLYFLGSDDELYDKDVLQKVSKEIKNENYDFVYGNIFSMYSKVIYDGEFTKRKLLTERNICHQAIFYKRDIFDKLGDYNLEYKIWADWDFNIRCFSCTKIKIKYIDLLIAKFNDFDGISSKGRIDPDFYCFLPLKQRFEETKTGSIDYKIGFWTLKPVRFVKKLFSFIFENII